MSREPPEIQVKVFGLTVTAKGIEAVRAIRWPAAAVILAVACLIIVLACRRV